MALESREERQLGIPGHTVHFDGMLDQGRDREVTRYLAPKTDSLSPALNQIEREQGLREVRELLRGSMRGRTLIVRFMTLGPNRSDFSIPCVEITDSPYVSHALDLLYRPGYEEFRRLGPKAKFFSTLHSSGVMDARMISVETDKKRIYIDYTTDMVYSVNTQYGGNTIGLKKPALRLAIRKADREGWLAEHMHLRDHPGRDRKERSRDLGGARQARRGNVLECARCGRKPVLARHGGSSLPMPARIFRAPGIRARSTPTAPKSPVRTRTRAMPFR
jgi:phosphoenolpyruvate carboxykinase (GTP)